MPTPKEIERQVKLESESVQLGLKKLYKQTKKLEDQNYASASVYGNSIIDDVMPHLVKHLEDTQHRMKAGKNGVMYAEIATFLDHLSKEESSLIALKVFIDHVFSSKATNRTVTAVCAGIGMAIEHECQMRYYKNEFPGLFQSIVKHHWHSSMGTQQKLVTTRTLINRAEDTTPWSKWPNNTCIKIGSWYADAICSKTGWFKTKSVYKKPSIFEPSEAFSAYQEEIFKLAELFCPIKLPMLTEPNNWGLEGEMGGYYTNQLTRNYQYIRKVRRGTPLKRGKTPVEFLNRIQKTSYRVNRFMADVAETLWERGIEVGKFKPIRSAPVVPKPHDIEDNAEARKDYCRRRAKVENEHRDYLKRTVRTRITLETLRMFRDEEKFYVPWSFCYRGRVYPIPAFLTPQCTDFGKSLIQFYEGAFITPEAEDWLAFQVATTYGLDKAPMHERMQWVKDNRSLIHAIAQDPIGNLPQWEVADEPWQFLAACEEYNACIIDCSRHFTHLPVAVDATCSGIQILAGLARDKSAAKLVNVTPSDCVQDAYAVIAEASKPLIPDEIKPHWDRKCVKRVVMTIPYNAKAHSNRDYIRKALREEKGIDVEPDVLTELVKVVRKTIEREIPGPMKVMAWIEKEIANAFRKGADTISWITPSGFEVRQHLQKRGGLQRIETVLFGDRFRLPVAQETDDPDVRRHKNATAPNLIHSLDSSMLHLTVLRWDAPIALIHDSVLCRATDMSSLNTIIRETYKHLFAENDFLTDFAKQIGAETEPPIIGDLKPENVMASTYFFC